MGGGLANAASGYYATVAGGGGEIDVNFLGDYFVPAGNTASGNWSAIGGGESNNASGYYATISGGYGNVAAGGFSSAAGNQAQALNYGSFVWNDGSGGAFASTADNQFAVHAVGGLLLAGNVQMGTNASDYRHFTLGGGNSFGYLYGAYPTFGDGIHLGYNIYYDANGNGHIGNPGGATSRITAGYGVIKLDIGGVNAQPNTDRLVADSSGVAVYGTFNNSSDRNVKQDIAPVSPSQILDRVLQLPVSEWSYKTDSATRHIGPMGQDFHSVFNIGTDDKHIAPIDEGGVALAAIQGLNQKVEVGSQSSEVRSQRSENRIQKLEMENAELKQRLEKLEQMMNHQSGGAE